MSSKHRCATILTGIAASVGMVAAQAGPVVINFDQIQGNPATGTITYDGAGGAAVGSGINLSAISGVDTSQNTGSANRLECPNTCILDFTTGNNVSENADTWTFGTGGSFTVTGTAQDTNGNVIASGTLLSGSFTSDPANPNVVASTSSNILTFNGYGDDTKNPDILNYFGVDSDLDFKFANTAISARQFTTGADGSFDATITNADLADNGLTAVPPNVSEPSILGLFGLGLLGISFAARGRKRS